MKGQTTDTDLRHIGCGGVIAITDHGTHNQWRYEVFCRKCHTCDPNGWGSKAKAMEEALDYFGTAHEKGRAPYRRGPQTLPPGH